MYGTGETLPIQTLFGHRQQDCIKRCCSADFNCDTIFPRLKTLDASACVISLYKGAAKFTKTEKILSLCWDFQQPSDQQRASLVKRTNNLSHIRALGDSQPSAELAPLLEYKTPFCTVIGRRRACVGLERCGPGGDKGHSGWTWKTISTGCKGDCNSGSSYLA